MQPLQLFPITGLPIIKPGDDLAAMLADALRGHARAHDALVVTSKIVSKAEGRFVNLRDVTPSAKALELAQKTGKDARLAEMILQESQGISRTAPNLIISQHRLGFVSANAGIDHSNVGDDPDLILLLPRDPDASAKHLADGLAAALGFSIPVILADSHGRPHRMGTVGVAIGVSGMPGVEDWRGRPDLFGYKLQHTDIGLADMVASAATLVMGQAAESTPAVLVRGLVYSPRDGNAAEIIRPGHMNLFP
ncbi:MAG TPA: coenzyme F420-0:L-glutamate ligase [Thermoflexales bacterium]|nr:coenzyme F420-0:L-glutamate ligase [Thermoflexales bacterium]HQW35329.1 coenzyme F420-0:L-glutamate ligase [Thermoflexales bacterium]HQX75221.1 coenzyme F420-0:L-glutamate ligase [Thermoflexales bacterium]HQZ20635.1 coenzyme F420-0:L-glutamate ligase [Thermoflexales bacterium]